MKGLKVGTDKSPAKVNGNGKEVPTITLNTQWESKMTEASLQWPEDVNNPLVKSRDGWHVEVPSWSNDIEYDDKYMDLCYTDNFNGKDHALFLGGSLDNPIFAAVEKGAHTPKKALIRMKDGDQRIYVKQAAAKDVQHALKAKGIKADITEVKTHQEVLARKMCSWERLGTSKTFKFGVLYCKQGQNTESEMLCNESGSEEFEKFLDLLGVRVKLKEWSKFSGGLSVEGDLDGMESVYTQFHTYEVMFHVSTLLHYRADDPQQIDRKRHIGNDIVILVFMDQGASSLLPGFLRTQFNHVYFVVQPTPTENGNLKYALAVAAKHGVPPFGPMLPNIPEFDIGSSFKEYLLTKMVNAERAALNAPAFVDLISKHRQIYIANLLTNFCE